MLFGIHLCNSLQLRVYLLNTLSGCFGDAEAAEGEAARLSGSGERSCAKMTRESEANEDIFPAI